MPLIKNLVLWKNKKIDPIIYYDKTEIARLILI